MEAMDREARRYEEALNAAQALKPVPLDCHDCGAKPGELHRENCDSPHCTICGTQLLQCGHEQGNSVHTGIESQEVKILCEALGLFTKWTDKGWMACKREDPEAHYGLNEGMEKYIRALLAVRRRELAELEQRKEKKMG